ncbi:DinB family protein [Christiangramia sabulilitoris]|uniref:DinB family protein n=1 Tax=Christiangramia sabulilitoris TaxID=2583991 RepID=A0A550I3E4_9FLAO|nr:DinB family protein [Christiangramia sabulilitoris]TRO65338.1 DinB family protein [Christiangramia sabulilitoris]
MISDKESRKQLVAHLEGGLAYASIESFIDAIPFGKIRKRPSGLPYSFYEVFFHIWFAQKDILDYINSPEYSPKEWPTDYWPDVPEPASEEEWEDLKANYFEDRKLLKDHLLNEEFDLGQPVLNSQDHTLLREILLVIEHTAYHTGQLLLIQRLLGVYDN